MKSIIVLYLSVLLCFTNAYAENRNHYSVGIVPQQSARTILQNWTLVFDFISKKTGLRFSIQTAPDIPTFEQRAALGEYDIVYANPQQYLKINKELGYYAIAKELNNHLQGIIVVNKSSRITSLSQLEGQSIVFPRNAFAASQITQMQLNKLSINFKPHYVNTHDLSYGGVAHSLYVAGGGVPRTFMSQIPSIRNKLRILWISENYSTHAIAVSPGLNRQVASRIARAFSELHKEPEGRQSLEKLKFEGFTVANDDEWNDARALFNYAASQTY